MVKMMAIFFYRREGVYRIDFESAYEKRIEQLYYLKEQKHEAVKFCGRRCFLYGRFILLGVY